MSPMYTDAARSMLARLNRWMANRTIGILLGLVVFNLLVPGPALALKAWRITRIPVVGWAYDFPTLALTLMMLAAATQCRLEDFVQLRRRPRACGASLLLVYMLAPALALLVSGLGLSGFEQEAATELRLGLFLVSLMPVAMTAAVWVRIAAGNVALLLALIALTTTLSVVSVPLYCQLMPALAGKGMMSVPMQELVKQLVLSVTLPLAAGLAARRWAEEGTEKVRPLLCALGNVGLFAALSTNVAGASVHLISDLRLIAIAGMLTISLNVGFFALALVAARRLRARRPGLPHDDAVALLFGGGMRSTGTAMVLGAAAFPAMPLVTVPAALYSISQQILAGYLSRTLGPGARLLRTAIGRNRQALESKLRELVLENAGQVTLIVFRVRSARTRVVPLLELMPMVRRRLRSHDFVSLVHTDHFAILLTGVPRAQANKLAQRVDEALRAHVDGIGLRWAVTEAQTPCPVARVVDLACEGVLGPWNRAEQAAGMQGKWAV